jgi:hypothetical protein
MLMTRYDFRSRQPAAFCLASVKVHFLSIKHHNPNRTKLSRPSFPDMYGCSAVRSGGTIAALLMLLTSSAICSSMAGRASLDQREARQADVSLNMARG